MGILREQVFEVPVISIGNITVGGTGKTPHTEYLVTFFMKNFKVAVLSRGYKRRTKGFLLAGETTPANDIGDEPKQIKTKFPGISVAVDEKRAEGIEKLLQLSDKPGMVLLDDAFQHRYVKPGLSVLLIDYNQPPEKDFLLPAGRLRESFSGKKRAHIMVVSKCPPDLKPIEKRIITTNLNLLAFQRVFFTAIAYQQPIPVFSTLQGVNLPFLKDFTQTDVLLVTGIAQPKQLLGYLQPLASSVKHFSYADHHFFSAKEIYRLVNDFKQLESPRKIILTTEKDAIRLREAPDVIPLLDLPIYYLPVGIQFLFDEEEQFKQLVMSYIDKNETITSKLVTGKTR